MTSASTNVPQQGQPLGTTNTARPVQQEEAIDLDDCCLCTACKAFCTWTNPAVYGSGTEDCQRSLTLTFMVTILFPAGCVLTGYTGSVKGPATIIGPMCIVMALLLTAISIKYYTVAKAKRLQSQNYANEQVENEEPQEDAVSEDSLSLRNQEVTELPPSYSEAIVNSSDIPPDDVTDTLEQPSPHAAHNGIVFTLDDEQSLAETNSPNSTTDTPRETENNATEQDTYVESTPQNAIQNTALALPNGFSNPNYGEDSVSDSRSLPPSYTEVNVETDSLSTEYSTAYSMTCDDGSDSTVAHIGQQDSSEATLIAQI